MANDFQKLVMSNKNEAVLNLESTATFLGISKTTVRNWVKCGYLQPVDEKTKYLFYLSDIEKIKLNIDNGNLKKLCRRANKSKGVKTFVPEEYSKDKNKLSDVNKIIEFVYENNIDLFLALLLIGINFLKKEKILSEITIEDIIFEKNLSFSNMQISKEINNWLSKIKKETVKSNYSLLLNCPIPKQRDVLGFIYQSLLLEGKKSQTGTYYTPSIIVDEIIGEYVKKDSKVLDPCCGTGQFLLAFADVIENPLNIYGIDSDEIAVRVARLNILVKYKNKNFVPNIIRKNTLFDVGDYDLFSLNDENIKNFDVIATNPPWGVHFSQEEAEKLKQLYPTITSFESFSYFLKKSIDLLHNNGLISFILPESILNVKTHKDIREIILNNTHIKKIVHLNRVFKNVFTPVIRLDLKKSKKENGKIKIYKKNESYDIEQTRWENNQDLIFDIYADGFDEEIINKIYATPHTTLEKKADWALGIVTGNNSTYITNKLQKGFEEVYKGKDVEKFILNKPSSYIQFPSDKFQQVAPTFKYRANEKLIYRFISKYLIFAYDNKQKLSLNSANILIPKISNYSIKVIAALFNSSLYQFIFQKKFSSIKVLRSHIEQLPLPLWDKKTFEEIIEMVDLIIKNEPIFEKLDNYIMGKYALLSKEKKYLKGFNK